MAADEDPKPEDTGTRLRQCTLTGGMGVSPAYSKARRRACEGGRACDERAESLDLARGTRAHTRRRRRAAVLTCSTMCFDSPVSETTLGMRSADSPSEEMEKVSDRSTTISFQMSTAIPAGAGGAALAWRGAHSAL